jgi:hypothetical protein
MRVYVIVVICKPETKEWRDEHLEHREITIVKRKLGSFSLQL